ncbi:hypothetical protein BGZ95_010056 [Linnemannia exigua]|uniref:Uncharacterized protein n=1 Tax=Linnemannia exigua TaxID=604196 RepID=A0AAD4DBS8_9FUNG|nr:hypothetical protein BGZ95_010056 [Linnemannia exigua]
MAVAGDFSGRKYILIALNSTKSQQIHDELAKTPGLAKVLDWIKEARREVDILDGSNDSDQEARKVLLYAIHVLGRAPAEQRPDFANIIKSLTNDQKYPADIVKAASDLLATWATKTGNRSSSRSGAIQPHIDGRKRARMDSGSVGGFSEDLTMLPKFTKKSASESAPKSTSSSSTATVSSFSYASASSSSSSSSSSSLPLPLSSSSTPTAKGGPSSRRIDRSVLPLSVLTGRNLPPGTAMPASPRSSKAVSSPHQPYSPRGALTSAASQSPRSAHSPKNSQVAFSSTAADKVLERQKDFFSSISVPSNTKSKVTSTAVATTSASAPTTPTTAKPPAVITTAAITATKAVKGPGIVLPDGKHLASALVLKHASTKKVVRFKGGDDIQEVRIVPNRDDVRNWDYQGDYRDYDYDRDHDHDSYHDGHDDDDNGYDDDNNHDYDRSHGPKHDQDRDYRNEDEGRRDYDRDDRDPYRLDRHDDRDRGREYEQGLRYDQGHRQGYDEQMSEPGYHEYDHGREHQYDHGQGHEYDHEYEHGHRQEPLQLRQHTQYYQEPNAFPETAFKEDNPEMPKMSDVPTFRLPKEDIELAILGDSWSPPRPLLIQHPFDQSHKEPATFGEESEEKKVQEDREAIVTSVQYLDLTSIPPSPAEPDDDGIVDPRPERKIGLYEIEADYHKVAIPMLSMFLQVIQARRKEMGR